MSFLFFSICLISVRLVVRYLGFGRPCSTFHGITKFFFIKICICIDSFATESRKREEMGERKKQYSIQKSITQHLQWDRRCARVLAYIFHFPFLPHDFNANGFHTFYSSNQNAIMHFEIAFNGAVIWANFNLFIPTIPPCSLNGGYCSL